MLIKNRRKKNQYSSNEVIINCSYWFGFIHLASHNVHYLAIATRGVFLCCWNDDEHTLSNGSKTYEPNRKKLSSNLMKRSQQKQQQPHRTQNELTDDERSRERKRSTVTSGNNRCTKLPCQILFQSVLLCQVKWNGGEKECQTVRNILAYHIQRAPHGMARHSGMEQHTQYKLDTFCQMTKYFSLVLFLLLFAYFR